MTVQGPFTYVPVLVTRAAEIKAVAGLPEESKNLLSPVFLLRPWPNAKELGTTIDKIAEAFAERPFFLSLSRALLEVKRVQQAHLDFYELVTNDDGYAKYYNFVENTSNASPVLQFNFDSIPQIERQIEHARRIDRGLLVHIPLQNSFDANYIFRELANSGIENISFLLDAGWGGRDILSFSMLISSYIKLLREHINDPQIIVCSSSFPENFQGMGIKRHFPIFERQLYQEVSRQFNDIIVSYGDWGSTRPIRPNAPMTTVKRLDLPLPNSWLSFRELGEKNTYKQIAVDIVGDSEWPRNLKLWGIYQILATAEGAEGAIQGQAGASAVRINIHLHRQVYYDDPTNQGDVDEPYID